jgi:hypothetical protein
VRNGYDTKIRSDSGGMYLEMGSMGNNELFRVGAYTPTGSLGAYGVSEGGDNRGGRLGI